MGRTGQRSAPRFDQPRRTNEVSSDSTEQDYRIEKDSMGDVRVPRQAKWRAQTQRAVENFPISGQPIERELIAALALIKGAGARVRARRGELDESKAFAIAAAALIVTVLAHFHFGAAREIGDLIAGELEHHELRRLGVEQVERRRADVACHVRRAPRRARERDRSVPQNDRLREDVDLHGTCRARSVPSRRPTERTPRRRSRR